MRVSSRMDIAAMTSEYADVASARAKSPMSTRARTASRYVFMAIAATRPNIRRQPRPNRALAPYLGHIPPDELRHREENRADALLEEVADDAGPDIDEDGVGEQRSLLAARAHHRLDAEEAPRVVDLVGTRV